MDLNILDFIVYEMVSLRQIKDMENKYMYTNKTQKIYLPHPQFPHLTMKPVFVYIQAFSKQPLVN